jgi:hypothetical protein
MTRGVDKSLGVAPFAALFNRLAAQTHSSTVTVVADPFKDLFVR